MVLLCNMHEPIIERTLWEYTQDKLDNSKVRRNASKQSQFSGFLRCGDCGSNLHFHVNHTNPSIEYYNCSNHISNRSACLNTHYVRLDDLSKTVLSNINQLIAAAKSTSFWEDLLRLKSCHAFEQIDAITAEIQIISRHQAELSKLLIEAYEDKVKGVIDDETFILLINSFKKERSQRRQQNQQAQEKVETARNFQSGLDYFQTIIKKQEPVIELTRNIVGQFIDQIAVYPADRTVRPYCQQIDVYYHFIGRIDIAK